MIINEGHFDSWMKKLYEKMCEVTQNLKIPVNSNGVFEKEEKPLDNQDVSLMLKVSHRSLQRYRTEGKLKHFFIGGKVYYKPSDIKEFVYAHGDHWDRKAFEESVEATEDAISKSPNHAHSVSF
jgi:hypothetical protein